MIKDYKNKNILIIDDDPLFRNLIDKLFSPYGYLIDQVSRFESAISNFKKNDYALIILDFNLNTGNHSGLDILRALRELSTEVEIVMITGSPSLELALEAFEEGIYDFILKPADMRKVKNVIERAMEKFELTQSQKELTQDLLEKNQELQQANSKLLEALEEAKTFQAHLASSKKLAGVGELTASVAHEFNNILGAIRGYSQLAMRNGDNPDYLLESHKNIKGAVDRAIKVVGNLLMFSRRVKPELKVADINQAIDETLSLAQHHLALKEISLNVKYGALPHFQFDYGQLQQVFLNLVTNASHALDKGGNLWIRSFIEGDYAVMEFRDDGKGIPDNIKEKIFVPFFSTKTRDASPKGQQMGSGLGLFVSKQIIESHTGKIEVESILGKGTTFVISIPLVEISEGTLSELSELPQSEIAPPQKAPGRSYKAMVVDDEPDIRHVLAKFLEDKGFVTREADDGQQCLNILEEDPEYHLIFMDLMMPNINGEEALHVIKDKYPRPSIFMMSGYGNQNTTNKILALGAERYISKPFDLDELEEYIQQEMEKFDQE